jgi:hypothetical protein
MEYKEVVASNLVVGQRYYIVPLDRLKVAKLVTPGIIYGQHIFITKPIPAAKKGTILLQSAVLTENNPSYPFTRKFSDFLNKDGKPLAKSPDVSKGEFKYFSYEPTPVPIVGSTVSEANVASTVGNLSPNYMPPSMNSAAAGAGSAVPDVPTVAETEVATPAVQKSTDLLIKALTSGESGVITISSILKRANPPLLENLVNHPLSPVNGEKLIPIEFDIPATKGFRARRINVHSPYGALELLIESNERLFSHDDKMKYIELLVSKGADPSNALVTAILHYDLPIVNLLLDLGADPNIVREYKTPDGKQRFLTSPLLASLPVRMILYNDAWITPILDSLTQFRTFVEKDGHLVLVDRDSIPEGTPVYETVAHITPNILETLQKRLDDNLKATEIRKAVPSRKDVPSTNKRNILPLMYYEKYTTFLNAMIGFLTGKSEQQASRLAEPGGPIYEEARARAYGNKIGTIDEQRARNRVANEAIGNMGRNMSSSNELQRMELLAEHGIRGGSKTRKRRSTRHRHTRHRHTRHRHTRHR